MGGKHYVVSELSECSISANAVYQRLADKESRDLFELMLRFNVTENERAFALYRKKFLFEEYKVSLDEFLGQEGDKVIFGAGKWGKWLFSVYSDVQWKCFADNFPKENDTLPVPVISAKDLVKYPNAKIVIAVIDHTDEIMAQLLQMKIKEENLYPLGKELKRIESDLLERQYFDLPYLRYEDEEIFVDVGCFDGFTSLNFAQVVGNRYGHIYAFEANPALYNRCRENMRELKNCTVYNQGIWNKRDSIDLYEAPDDSEFYSTLSEHNGYQHYHQGERWLQHKVDVVPLDDTLSGEKVTFIKMDIERAERQAILGAKEIISKCKPKLAISLYHRKDDITDLPALVLDVCPDYKLYIRNYTFSWPETVLYAL